MSRELPHCWRRDNRAETRQRELPSKQGCAGRGLVLGRKPERELGTFGVHVCNGVVRNNIAVDWAYVRSVFSAGENKERGVSALPGVRGGCRGTVSRQNSPGFYNPLGARSVLVVPSPFRAQTTSPGCCSASRCPTDTSQRLSGVGTAARLMFPLAVAARGPALPLLHATQQHLPAPLCRAPRGSSMFGQGWHHGGGRSAEPATLPAWPSCPG